VGGGGGGGGGGCGGREGGVVGGGVFFFLRKESHSLSHAVKDCVLSQKKRKKKTTMTLQAGLKERARYFDPEKEFVVIFRDGAGKRKRGGRGDA